MNLSIIFLIIIILLILLIIFKKHNKKIYFITLVDNNSIHKCENLKKTLKNDLIIIDTYDHSIGNFSKLFKFREFLKNDFNIKDDDIICFMDAFDVLCLKYDPEGILNEFKKYNKKIIIGCEENCGPEHTQEVKEYFRNKSGFYLNGGFQIGYKSEFIKLHDYIYDNFEILKKNLEIDRNTEQGIISQVYIKEIFDIGIDNNFTLVNNWGTERDLKNHDSFFIHVIRADTNAKKFVLTDELKRYRELYEKGVIKKYDKHLDMIYRHKAFEEQTERYKNILNKLNIQ